MQVGRYIRVGSLQSLNVVRSPTSDLPTEWLKLAKAVEANTCHNLVGSAPPHVKDYGSIFEGVREASDKRNGFGRPGGKSAWFVVVADGPHNDSTPARVS